MFTLVTVLLLTYVFKMPLILGVVLVGVLDIVIAAYRIVKTSVEEVKSESKIIIVKN